MAGAPRRACTSLPLNSYGSLNVKQQHTYKHVPTPKVGKRLKGKKKKVEKLLQTIHVQRSNPEETMILMMILVPLLIIIQLTNINNTTNTIYYYYYYY